MKQPSSPSANRLTNTLDMEHWEAKQAVNAAIVNISGRQRMLSQRTAMLALRWACCSQAGDRAALRAELTELVAQMERAHRGLIEGDASLHLPGNPSPSVRAMYFEPPWNVDRKVHDYLHNLRRLLDLDDRDLFPQHPILSEAIAAASDVLLPALDAVVTQYQAESETEQVAIAQKQVELYQQRCEAAAEAEEQTQKLQAAFAELHQMQSQLLQTEKMSSLGQLVAGIAHEINNPINFISGNISHAAAYVRDLLQLLNGYQTLYPDPPRELQEFAEEIDLDFVRDDVLKLLRSMKTGSDRIRQLVSSLRTFARTDEADYKTVNLHDGLDSTLLILQHRIEGDRDRPPVCVRRHYGQLPSVTCYAGQLNQVFLNIFNNALDALEEREKRCTPEELRANPSYIDIRTEAVGDRWIEIAIADNGIGIPEAHRARIFDPFFTTKPVGQGTGLGMSVSYQIVTELHGGRLDCHSSLREGTEFRIRIPQQTPSRSSSRPLVRAS